MVYPSPKILASKDKATTTTKTMCFGCTTMRKGLLGRIGIFSKLKLVCGIETLRYCSVTYDSICPSLVRPGSRFVSLSLENCPELKMIHQKQLHQS